MYRVKKMEGTKYESHYGSNSYDITSTKPILESDRCSSKWLLSEPIRFVPFLGVIWD